MLRPALFACLFLGAAAPLPGEIPASFTPAVAEFDFARREAMIPMRDGVKLHTVILVPKGAARAPIVLERTPYDADKFAGTESPNLAADLRSGDDVIAGAGYIRVFQDVRGKYGSEGDYVMNRPFVGPLNSTGVDHATDTYDTIDWLVKNVPESNGRVGIIGTSYDGFTALAALVHPHPALKVAVPIAPMVDGWMGDDWFHNGAFREQMISYIYKQEATKSGSADWWTGFYDDYDAFLAAGSAGSMAAKHGMGTIGFWQKLIAHPAYDAFWQDQAVDRILARDGISVPTMLVDGLWDQEDIYGAPAVWRAVHPRDAGHFLHLAIGPWRHGGSNGDGSSLGAMRFDGDTARWFRRTALLPFLDMYLKDSAVAVDTPPVLAYETGVNVWHRYEEWPQSCASGCVAVSRALYLEPGFALGFGKPAEPRRDFDEYVSDPAHPVPYRVRPDVWRGAKASTWREWLVDDQREFSTRTDVLTYTSAALTAPLRVAGQPVAHLFAATSGTDADFVVKLIDVYPDEVPAQAELGGYQLMVAADILRGRYRADPARAVAIEPGKVLPYRLDLPQVSHTFLPGHRVMVQIQSSWFPLYDRNPQSFVGNVFLAKPGDYRRETQRVYHAPDAASFVDLPVVAGH